MQTITDPRGSSARVADWQNSSRRSKVTRHPRLWQPEQSSSVRTSRSGGESIAAPSTQTTPLSGTQVHKPETIYILNAPSYGVGHIANRIGEKFSEAGFTGGIHQEKCLEEMVDKIVADAKTSNKPGLVMVFPLICSDSSHNIDELPGHFLHSLKKAFLEQGVDMSKLPIIANCTSASALEDLGVSQYYEPKKVVRGMSSILQLGNTNYSRILEDYSRAVTTTIQHQ